MSARKTSLTDKQAKNGTSKYVLERCASINEYYDVAFKVMLLGDSAVGKTCVLVRFKDGAFLGGNFIATVGIDFRVGDSRGAAGKEVLFLYDTFSATQSALCDSEVDTVTPEQYEILMLKSIAALLRAPVRNTLGVVHFPRLALGLQEIRGHPYRAACRSLLFPQNKVVEVDNLKVKLQIWDTAGQERFRSVTHAYYRDAQALLLLYDITNKPSFDNIRVRRPFHLLSLSSFPLTSAITSAQSRERVVKTEEGEKLAKEYGVPFMETSAKTGVNVELAFLAIAKELKHRATQLPNEPKFKLHDYIESQKHKSGCCR
uniref:small monomeric GTPase n=1 Tax=Poecilia formosa TaxID=48698 RepID=A0A096MIN7_POEFO